MRSTASRLWAALALLLVLGGCARVSDAEQELLCRRLIPALIEASDGVVVTGSETVGAGEVFVTFRLRQPPSDHFVYCRFAGTGLSLSKRTITRIGIDGLTLGPSATFYLTRGWLESQDSVAAMPAPASRTPLVGAIGTRTGYALQQAVSALPRMGIYALLAAAYALIYGLIGRILLAFGAFAALGGMSAVLSVLLVERLGSEALGLGILAAFGGAVACSALYGAVAGRLVLAPLLHRPGQHLLVAGVGLMIALEEFLRLAQGARGLWLAPVFNAVIPLAVTAGFTVTATPIALMAALLATLAALGLAWLMARTRYGRAWRASSEEAVAAELFGIGQSGLAVKTFALAAALAGFSGFLVTMLYGGIGYSGGATLGLTALVAAVLGGIGSVHGAMLGGVLIGVFEAAWSAVLPADWREAVLFALLAAFLALKPDGLFAGRVPQSMRV